MVIVSGETNIASIFPGMDRGEKRIVAISEDSFYRELDEKESLQAGRGMFNFDHPDAFDTDTMMRCLAGTLINATTTSHVKICCFLLDDEI